MEKKTPSKCVKREKRAKDGTLRGKNLYNVIRRELSAKSLKGAD